MRPRSIQRANCAYDPEIITLNCLALPNRGAKTTVKVLYGEGTMNTDLTDSETIQSILQLLGLNEDPNHAGCREFFITVHVGPLKSCHGRPLQ
jgi:hypothetical protein